MRDLMEDRGRLEAFRRGERDALASVFDQYAPRVASWVAGGFSFRSGTERRRFDGFRSAADAHDVVHEVFRRAFEAKARTRYSGLEPFDSYLFVITRNTSLSRLKRVDLATCSIDEAQQIESPEPSPEERVASAEDRAKVRAFLATLTEEERRFAELRFVERLSQVEVARRLEMTRKKVRRTETAIRGALVRHLKRGRGTLEIEEAAHEGSR